MSMTIDNEAKPLAVDAEFAATLGLGKRSKKPWVKWGVAGLAAVLALAGGWYVWLRFFRPSAVDYQTSESKRGDLVVTVTATGSLRPVNTVDVGAEISGRVEKVAVDFNQRVVRGQPLAEIDTRQLRAQVERSEASLEVAEASLLQARATLAEARGNAARNEALSAEKLISTFELEATAASLARAEAGGASARAQVTVANAILNSDRTNLEKAVIRSPIDGMVIARQVEPGQTVAASFQTPVLFKLAEDLARMDLHVDVDEADMGMVKEGQPAVFTVDAHPGSEFSARIRSLRNDPRTVQGVVSYEAVLTVDNSEGLLRPGMTATASITTEHRTNVLLVANSALRFTPPNAKPPKLPGGEAKPNATRSSHVWTLRDGKPFALRTDKGLTDGKFTEALGGEVKAGDVLLVDVVAKEREE